MKIEQDKSYSIIVDHDDVLIDKVLRYLIDIDRIVDKNYDYLYSRYSIEIWGNDTSRVSHMGHKKRYWTWMEEGAKNEFCVVYAQDIFTYVPEELFIMD